MKLIFAEISTPFPEEEAAEKPDKVALTTNCETMILIKNV